MLTNGELCTFLNPLSFIKNNDNNISLSLFFLENKSVYPLRSVEEKSRIKLLLQLIIFLFF